MLASATSERRRRRLEDAANVQDAGVVEEKSHVGCLGSHLRNLGGVGHIELHRDDAAIIPGAERREIDFLTRGCVHF